ncbi:hypothetical protein BX592_12230 [Paraburkholderia rhizosphaerae]|uniref:Uncharacterized protein n=1 Tax=Paraburkholderia rhizosphaerae TaxID=480658 RepID=A0A4R8LGG0_9BURK|nr:hypothetical protein BX592_12230 [Paraburkholderia rhizosphaerae]
MRGVAVRPLMPEHRHLVARHVDGRRDDPQRRAIANQPRRQHCNEIAVCEHRLDDAGFAALRDALGERLDTLFSAQPIPFRRQNGGDYVIPALTLRADITSEKVGFAAHVADPVEQAADATVDQATVTGSTQRRRRRRVKPS